MYISLLCNASLASSQCDDDSGVCFLLTPSGKLLRSLYRKTSAFVNIDLNFHVYSLSVSMSPTPCFSSVFLILMLWLWQKMSSIDLCVEGLVVSWNLFLGGEGNKRWGSSWRNRINTEGIDLPWLFLVYLLPVSHKVSCLFSTILPSPWCSDFSSAQG